MPAERRVPIRTPARVIVLGRLAAARLFDQIHVHQPFERAIEGGRPKPHFPLRAVENLLD
jgi:hypothetical protein